LPDVALHRRGDWEAATTIDRNEIVGFLCPKLLVKPSMNRFDFDWTVQEQLDSNMK
jgi:hypothetical protein